MNSKSQPAWSSPWRWGGYIFPTLIAIALVVSPIGLSLEMFSFDLLYLFRPDPPPSKLAPAVILSMDEESHRLLHQDPSRPWDRRVHARLLRELASRRARVVAFDVLFAEPSPDPAADEQFGVAIREHGGVVLAASLKSSQEAGSPRVLRLIPPVNVLGSNAVSGVVELGDGGSSSAGVIRCPLNFADYTNFAWQAAALFGQVPPDTSVARWLNYYGPGGTLPAVSYHRALETNALPADFFTGKAVFIGRGDVITPAGQAADLHGTPFSKWKGGRTSGVEIQATAFLNLLNHDWLERVSPATELLVIFVIGGLLGFGLPRVKPWLAAAMSLSVALVVAAIAVVLTWSHHLWFPWLIVTGVQIPCALGWAILAHTRRLTREKEDLERDVALAESVAKLPVLRGSGDTAAASLAAGAPPAPRAGEPPSIPNHRLLRPIGRGSYGEVWIARDDIGTHHAVKIVYQRSFGSATPYEREFRGIQKFTPISRGHPGFVHILHVGRNDPEGYFFYIMELGDDQLTGQQIEPATYVPATLATVLQAGRLALPACVQLGLDLTAALEHLHQHQLVHRDIKPSNIIFVNRAPKFADVGLVTHITPKGKDVSLVGTEGYLAPEGPGTPAADIYSLGKVFYEACTGRDRDQFPSLSGTLLVSGGEHFDQLNEIILKACHADRNQRYQSASDMHADLSRIGQRARD